MYAITPQFGLSVAVFAASFIALGGVSLIVGAGGHASRVSPRIGPPGEPNYRIIGALVAKCMVDFALILLQIPIQGTSGEYRVKVAFDMLLPTSMAGTMLLEVGETPDPLAEVLTRYHSGRSWTRSSMDGVDRRICLGKNGGVTVWHTVFLQH